MATKLATPEEVAETKVKIVVARNKFKDSWAEYLSVPDDDFNSNRGKQYYDKLTKEKQALLAEQAKLYELEKP